MRTFWNKAGFISRIALVCAGISALVNAATFLGVGAHGPMAAFFLMHLVAMALFFVALIRTGYHHSLYFKRGTGVGPLPGFETVEPLFLPVVFALGYLLLNFSSASSYGEGYPELTGDQYSWVRGGVVMRSMELAEVTKHEALELRLFSSAWIFFLLVVAGWDDIVRKRIATLKQLPSKECA